MFQVVEIFAGSKKEMTNGFFSKINVNDKPSTLELFCGITCHFRETLSNSKGIYLFSCFDTGTLGISGTAFT